MRSCSRLVWTSTSTHRHSAMQCDVLLKPQMTSSNDHDMEQCAGTASRLSMVPSTWPGTFPCLGPVDHITHILVRCNVSSQITYIRIILAGTRRGRLGGTGRGGWMELLWVNRTARSPPLPPRCAEYGGIDGTRSVVCLFACFGGRAHSSSLTNLFGQLIFLSASPVWARELLGNI